jgi:hypothetical protein
MGQCISAALLSPGAGGCCLVLSPSCKPCPLIQSLVGWLGEAVGETVLLRLQLPGPTQAESALAGARLVAAFPGPVWAASAFLPSSASGLG